MRIKAVMVLAVLVSAAWAQSPAPQAPGPVIVGGQAGGQRPGMMYTQKISMGKWWQNSETVKKLQLTDSQISQLDQIFYEHRLKLIDYGAENEKQDLKLQNMIDGDNPDEAQVNTQVDQVLAARGKLEREFTMMNLDLRKVLSLEQWHQLKSMRGESGGLGDHMFFRKIGPGAPGGPPGPMAIPDLPPPPPGDDM